MSDDATLIGYSDGGLFATYALLQQPAAFRRYVIGSPDLAWDDGAVMALETAYAQAHDDLEATVFLCAGADDALLPAGLRGPAAELRRDADTVALLQRLASDLDGRRYPNLRLTTRIFPEETHFTIPAILIAHGLRAVFSGAALNP